MISTLSLASLFTVEAREYKNFSLDVGDASLLTFLVFGICGGIVLAAIYMVYQKSVPGSLVRALFAGGAHTPETAKALSDLELRFLWLIRFELCHNPVLEKVVKTTGEGNDVRYYIPEATKYRAETRFEKRGSELLQLLVTVLLCVLLAILLFWLIPVVLSMVDAIL